MLYCPPSRHSFILRICAAFTNNLFHVFLGLSGAFLDVASQLLLLAFPELQVVIGELRKFLFQFAPGNVPASLDFNSIHKSIAVEIPFPCLTAQPNAAESSFAGGVPPEVGARNSHNCAALARFISGMRQLRRQFFKQERQIALQIAISGLSGHAACIVSRPGPPGTRARFYWKSMNHA